jgi:TfoX/Sxy family transcriptional regulator of competence genes
MFKSDEALVAAIRRSVGQQLKLTEVRMFGGTGFMLDGKFVVGTSKHGLLVRVGKDKQGEVLVKPGVKPMVMGARVSQGYVFVSPKELDADALRSWVRSAVDFVATLPRRPSKRKKKSKGEKS